MESIRSKAELKRAIEQLEFEQTAQLILLKEEFNTACERLKPINIIKNTWKEAYSEPDIKASVTSNLMGIVSGTIARKIILGRTNNPVTRFLGATIERLVSRSVANNADKIKNVAGNVLEKIANKHD